jgi:hypothetical protein
MALPYENTESNWEHLDKASKYARELDLVPGEAFVDRRNPEPQIFHNAVDGGTPALLRGFDPWELPAISTTIEFPDWEWPLIFAEGYEYKEGRQPILPEMWAEKSTMNDILGPLCHRYGVNLVTGLGFMSLPSIDLLINRIIKAGKPTRILYISDYDPAGNIMPIQVARRVEFAVRKSPSDLDIKLDPIVLTREQVDHYQLPRTPVSDTNLQKEGWEKLNGEGAVELDALEAKVPGELARIVRERIRQYRDNDLHQKYADADAEADEVADQFVEWIKEDHQDTRTKLRSRIEAVMESYQAELEDLASRFAQDMEQFRSEVESVYLFIQESLDNASADELPEVPEPEIAEDNAEWLFDSSRDYLEQLEYYKKRKPTPIRRTKKKA